MKVLNVNLRQSFLRVLREHDGTVGVAHSLENLIDHLPTRFEIDINTESSKISKQDRELYFDPSLAVGVGTTSGIGIKTDVYVHIPGNRTFFPGGPQSYRKVSIEPRSIFIPGHGLTMGEKIIYNSNTGDNLSISTNGIGSYYLSR